MVINPKAAQRFAEAMQTRTKTDAVDAAVLAPFAQRMPFTPWQRPDDPERRHFSRNPKWGPSDFGRKQWDDGHCLRRPASVPARTPRGTRTPAMA